MALGSCPLGYAAISSTSECDAAGSALGLTPGPWRTTDYGGNCAQWDGGWGGWGSNWYWYFAGNQASASLICASVLASSPTPAPTASPTSSPTPSPTSSPTPSPSHSPTPNPTPSPTHSPTRSPTHSPTPSPTAAPMPMNSVSGIGGGFSPVVPGASAAGSVAAVGDPHLQNIHGERFDLLMAGKHILINIPRGEPVENTMLRVEAEASRVGGSCADIYFQDLNVTGAWVTTVQKQDGGIRFRAQDLDETNRDWVKLGNIELKVAHGLTPEGTRYLNLFVKHLKHTGFAVGGLLGEDDHEEAATAPEACVQRLSLIQGSF